MSDQAPETGVRGRGNVFTRRIGPLPMWQWFLIALAMIGVYVIYEYRKKNAAAAGAASSAAGTPGGGTVGAGQVPQFVNQTYTYVAPPSAQPPPPSAQGGGLPRPAPVPMPASRPGAAPQPLSMPPASQGTISATAPNIRNSTLAAAIAALQQAGWGINTVSYAGQIIPSGQYSQYASTRIWSYTPLPGNKVNIGLQ